MPLEGEAYEGAEDFLEFSESRGERGCSLEVSTVLVKNCVHHLKRDVEADELNGYVESLLGEPSLNEHIKDPTDRPWDEEVERIRDEEEGNEPEETDAIPFGRVP